MAIVQNIPCIECQENGHDSTGNHRMVFEDGASLCNRAHFHKSGMRSYIAPDGEDPILKAGITGEIKYTAAQYQTLLDENKLDNPTVRAVALGGMRTQDAWDFMTVPEQSALESDWAADLDYYHKLKYRNLVSRCIGGKTAKFYGVKVGLDAAGMEDRHFYPRHAKGTLIGAKCRTLPKIWDRGTLGKMWGDGDLFGMHTQQAVAESGRRKHTLVLTGGECDAMAAQEMLLAAQVGTKYAGQYYHIWSPLKGEKAIAEIIHNREAIDLFKEIIVAFDDDETGQAMNKAIARLFRGKVKKLQMPSGCNDCNQCLMDGRHKEFVDAYWNPVDVFGGGTLKRVSAFVEAALKTPQMGLSFPWPSFNPLCFGIRDYALYVLGAGTGVGKTRTTMEIAFHITEQHGEEVGVLYLENQGPKVVRTFAGFLINKTIEEPPMNDPSADGYSKNLDYTEEEATAAIYRLEGMDKLIISDTGGRKDIDMVMEQIEELVAMGVKRIIIDNLTAIEMKGGGSKVDAIDEAMKRIGTFKDEHPVSIFLISHLKRPQEPRTPHENGGEVLITDFRGAGSITFWANVVFSAERNCNGMTVEEQSMTTYRIVKCRDRGLSVGKTVTAHMSQRTGRLLEAGSHEAYTPNNPITPQPTDIQGTCTNVTDSTSTEVVLNEEF